MTQTLVEPRLDVLTAIGDWLDDPTTSAQLIRRLGVTKEWVDELQSATEQLQSGLAAAVREITLDVPAPTADNLVDAADEVVVILNRVQINSLFTDSERGERNALEGTVVFNVNGQSTTLAWERLAVGGKWQSYDDGQKRLLFAGKPVGFLDLDVILIESDEAERAFLQKIADLLKVAGAFAGFIPGAGNAVSSAFNLGAAVAQLIKARMQDDAELRYLGSVGGSRAALRYGDYELRRHTQGGAKPDIVAKFSVTKFDTSTAPESVTIMLDNVQFQDGSNGESIFNLRSEDRVQADLTITGKPKKSDEEPRVETIHIDRPFRGENGADWPDTLGIENKLLYDGAWGLNIALNVSMSGIPKDVNAEEWMQVLQQTGALVESLADTDARPGIRRGFEIAETVRATVVKFLPKLRFASSLSTSLFVGVSDIDGLHRLAQNENWQDLRITLDLANYGTADFNLKVKLHVP